VATARSWPGGWPQLHHPDDVRHCPVRPLRQKRVALRPEAEVEGARLPTESDWTAILAAVRFRASDPYRPRRLIAYDMRTDDRVVTLAQQGLGRTRWHCCRWPWLSTHRSPARANATFRPRRDTTRASGRVDPPRVDRGESGARRFRGKIARLGPVGPGGSLPLATKWTSMGQRSGSHQLRKDASAGDQHSAW